MDHARLGYACRARAAPIHASWRTDRWRKPEDADQDVAADGGGRTGVAYRVPGRPAPSRVRIDRPRPKPWCSVLRRLDMGRTAPRDHHEGAKDVCGASVLRPVLDRGFRLRKARG